MENVIISLIIIMAVLGCVFYLLQSMPYIAEPFKSIMIVGCIVIAIIYLLRLLPGGTPLLH